MLSALPFECPPELLERGRGGVPTPTVVAGADSEVALESARLATAAHLIEPILVGEPAAIAQPIPRMRGVSRRRHEPPRCRDTTRPRIWPARTAG